MPYRPIASGTASRESSRRTFEALLMLSFPREDAEKRMQMIMDRTQGVLVEIRAAHASGHLGPDHTFAECPFEVIKDASGKIVGRSLHLLV